MAERTIRSATTAISPGALEQDVYELNLSLTLMGGLVLLIGL